jgi:hypothetical protein
MFSIESTYDGRALIPDEGIVGAATLVTGSLVALTKGAGKPTATIVTTAVPDALIMKGGVTGATCTFVRIFRGDVLKADVTEADGTTALTSGHNTSHIALVGSQAQRVAATGTNLDGVTEAGGKLELLSFDSVKVVSRVTIKA